MKLKILLTGGSGFIGKNFIEQRRKKYTILSPTHRQLDLANTDLVDSYFKKFGPFDRVLHAATVGGKRYEQGMKDVVGINLRMFFNMIRNKKYWKRMIHFGTGSEYDKSADIKSIRESDFGKRIPQDDFGFYKYITAKYIENSSQDISHLRLFGVYGKYEDYKVRLISNLICKYILKQPLTMIQNAYFDYLHVDDLITILDYFILKNPKQTFYNVCSGERIELLTLAGKINDLAAYKMPINIQKKGMNKEYTGNNNLLSNEIRKFNFTNIDVGIKKLYLWYSKNLKFIDISKIG